MNDFLNALPWRLAALAGLAVGAVSLLETGADFWYGMARVGAAFGLFFLIGSVAQKLLIIATPPPAAAARKAALKEQMTAEQADSEA